MQARVMIWRTTKYSRVSEGPMAFLVSKSKFSKDRTPRFEIRRLELLARATPAFRRSMHLDALANRGLLYAIIVILFIANMFVVYHKWIG